MAEGEGRGGQCMGTVHLPKHDWEKKAPPPSPSPLPGRREEAEGIHWVQKQKRKAVPKGSNMDWRLPQSKVRLHVE